ncbi:cell division protein FtsW (lipid II flippase) [Chryseobacterium ginsenosidimutans]|uniref:YcxB family protein n=1 Tax=Chryseobacterium ginsenosidimutans TaxID=687846 RepID=UPI0027804D53|nr:YcxB family protein [Chryseobacterium ginsenosidimutans]MDQ0593184.1 cell division protein FtsW (lipid II flippase) [Chryseobacterium ginsenosidimutans]
MNEEKVIVLKPKRQDFEEIYFSGNQGNLFFSSTTRGKTITTIVVGLILIILFFFKDDFTKEKFGVFYFVSFLFLLCAVFLSVGINKVSRWKKQVNSYLTKLENCKIYEITFDNSFFTVNIDGEKETSEWKDFEYFDSIENYIALEGKYTYMFPKKSMSEKDYNLLKKVLKENIKQ